MRILYVVTGTNLGGAEMQVLQLALGMARRGHAVRILSLAPPGPVARMAQEGGIEVDSLHVRGRSDLLRAVAGIARASRRWSPDVLHSHLVHANLLSRLSRPLAPVPLLISSGHSVQEGGAWSLQAYRLTDRLSDLTTNVSRLAVQTYRERRAVSPGRLRLMVNGLDLDAFDRAADGGMADGAAGGAQDGEAAPAASFCWLAVGRFEEAKDYPTLLRAFALLRADAPQARLEIVGEGRRRGEAEALARQLGLETAVSFLGARHDVPARLRRADGFVLSSAWEGLPMVLLEAGAARLPAVATDVGSVREAVAGGGGDLIVPPRDPERLAGAMRRLMATPERQRRELGEQARAHVERSFGLDRVLDEWETLYRTRRGAPGDAA